MYLNPNYNINHQVWLDAKVFVERQWVQFFDFYRNCAFGFVRIANEKKGYFAHLIIGDDNFLEGVCNCRRATRSKVCPHAFALFLKMINWPKEQNSLSVRFDAWPLTHFFKSMGHHYHGPVNKTTNPKLEIDSDDLDPRMLDYWEFTRTNERVAKRDQQSLGVAKSKVRSNMEAAMLARKMPSSQLQFEESIFYRLAKLFFFLECRSELEIVVESRENHQVELVIRHEGKPLFTWQIAIDAWLKGIRRQWDYWMSRATFEVAKKSLPLRYRITFTADNDLEVQAMVHVGDGLHETIAQLQVPGSSNLYFHANTGYFRIQTGLSPFEMEYSGGDVATISHQKVDYFLRQHRETLETLDRDLIDETVFGEVVTDRFELFELQLLDCTDHHFTIHLKAGLGDLWFTMDDLSKMFAGKGRYRKLGGRLFDMNGYDGAFLKQLLDDGNKLGVSSLFRLLTLFKDRLTVDVNDLAREVFDQLGNFQAPDVPSLDHTQLTLRPYQMLGYEWLHFLSTFGLGGLLCDQMGLGKTHQGMAMAAGILARNPEARVLVIAPASVLYHWFEKLNTFCPGIPARVHHGPDRNPETVRESGLLTLSSYGTVRNDIETFAEVPFDLVLYDEIQFVKNKKTKAWKALSQISATCRVGLTGTPIENDLRDIKGLFDLVMPDYLGSDDDFKRWFVDPIVKHDHTPSRARLRETISPFMLRRSKSQVLTELPEKTEDLRTLQMDSYSWDLYKEIKTLGKKNLKGLGPADNKFIILFQLVEDLKRICNHPALYFRNHDYGGYPSAKWEMFTELLSEALDSGEKIVVMTQYPDMVEMIGKYLRNQDIGYAAVHGKVKNRQTEQQRFRDDQECRVFVGTIRTSGVGIDLTSASIMIHYDRWWNPAIEEQATDRIHRIGQKKNVQVYKFKTMKSVEERINFVIERKKGLLEGVIEFDSQTASKALSVEELVEILA